MAVKLRLTRSGSKKNPIYRVVAADSRAPRDGKFLEIVGRYNPQTDPSTIEFDNQDASIPHNLSIYTDKSATKELFKGDEFARTDVMPALAVPDT